MTIEQLFGTLQQSVVDIWRAHLKTSKYSDHMAMDEYYKDMPELIDTLIENYMGRYGKVLSYESVLNPDNFTGPVEYLTSLRELVSQTYETISASELKSDLDAILSQIDSTVYKLKELTESAVEYTLEKEAGEYNQRLIESCKGCKKDSEEECETGKKPKKGKKIVDGEEEEIIGRKKQMLGKYKSAREEEKEIKEAGTEETPIREAVIGKGKQMFKKKYSVIDDEEECNTGKKVKESLSEFLFKNL